MTTMNNNQQTPQEWSYYNFDANWDKFYEVWKDPKTQNILEKDMKVWCKHEAYFDSDGKKPKWNKGSPLWNLSRTDYHSTKMLDKANEKNDREQIVETYRKQMEIKTGKKIDDDEFDEMCIELFEKLEEEFEPKPGTIDSLILVMGKNYLTRTLKYCAKQLFPNDNVKVIKDSDNSDMILVLNQRIVFDLLNYYFSTRDKPIPIDMQAITNRN